MTEVTSVRTAKYDEQNNQSAADGTSDELSTEFCAALTDEETAMEGSTEIEESETLSETEIAANEQLERAKSEDCLPTEGNDCPSENLAVTAEETGRNTEQTAE